MIKVALNMGGEGCTNFNGQPEEGGHWALGTGQVKEHSLHRQTF